MGHCYFLASNYLKQNVTSKKKKRIVEKKHYTGLTEQQVIESRQKYGENILTPPQRDPLWKLFLEKFEDPIIRILLIAALLSLGISFTNGHYAETIGVFCAIFLATGIGFWFEYDANRKFDVLNSVNDDTAVKVIRNGNINEIPKREVVVGDIIVLETGEEIPADGELLEAISLQINESSLTGEPMIGKTTRPEDFDEEATYPSNRVLRGTTIVNGHAIMCVDLVGDNTEIGKVARESTIKSEEQTPLNIQLDKLAKLISVIGFSIAIFTFVALFIKDYAAGTTSYTWQQLGFLLIVIISALVAFVKVWLPIAYYALQFLGKNKQLPKSVEKGSWLKWIAIGTSLFIVLLGIGYFIGINPFDTDSWMSIDTVATILQYFMVAVTLIVVSVPEGLPMSVTLSLALSMRRMLATNNLVRKMHACETMGATTVICTDKTGTLTQNQMRIYETKFSGLNDNLKDDNNRFAVMVKESMAANSTAHLDFSNPAKIEGIGNPTEAALLLWLNKNGINYLDLREQTEVVDQLTFSTERKYMATLVKSPLLNTEILYVKGAPEIVLTKCSHIIINGEAAPLSEHKKDIEEQLVKYQNQAMRTLAFAYKVFDKQDVKYIDDLADSGLVLLGVVAISDPVRADVPDAVEQCLNAGIQVKIVTGDTPNTAREIGRQIGIWTATDADKNLMTGVEFEKTSDEELLTRVSDMKIMARARPTDKQRLVQTLQKLGEVVAVTGDGTNDAPALNFAQVGLSMGTGTSVAKEASDITLLDDSFKSIVTAVMWGRSLYQNIQRFILFQLTINLVALIVVFIGSVFGHELPLTITQMLWVNLIMDTFAAGALASLPPDPKVMNAKPRKVTDFIITSPIRNNILVTGFIFVAIMMGLMYYFINYKGGLDSNTPEGLYNLTIFFTVFVMFQFWNLFNAKAYASGKSAFSEMGKNISFIIVAALIIVGQFIIVEIGGNVFRTTPLSLKDWLIIIASTSVVLWVGELKRLIKKVSK